MSPGVIPAEPNELMHLSYYGKGESGAILTINFYYCNAFGEVIGSFSGKISDTLSTTYQKYEADFVVPDNPNIAAIQAVMFNVYGASDPNDIIWVDNVEIKRGAANLIENSTFSVGSNSWYLSPSGAVWNATEGYNNTGCLKLQGNDFSAVGPLIPVEANKPMRLSYYGKGASGAILTINFYYCNSAGTVLGSFSRNISDLQSSSYQKYETEFTVPNNSDIAYIQPVLFNVYGASDPDDIIWVDNVVMTKY